MKPSLKKGIAGIGIAGSLFGGGVVADKTIDPYTDKGSTYEVVLTDKQDEGKTKVTLSKDDPSVMLSKWDDEANVIVRYPDVVASGNRKFLSNKVEWKSQKKEVVAYPLDPTDQMEDGGFEIEVILNEKPDTNVFEFPVEGYEDLDFFYQPPFTQDEIDIGGVRADNVIGSYAVYHKTKKNHAEGHKNYKTGKVFHIFRPKVKDAKGNEIWGELNYVDGLLTVTVDQGFLDNATYPVSVDPTFGNTVLGASVLLQYCHTSSDASNTEGSAYTLTEDGTLDMISVGMYSNNAAGQSADFFAAIYREDSAGSGSHDLVASVERTNLAVSNTPAFYDFTGASEVLVADSYILAGVCNGEDLTSLGIYFRYDDTGVNFYSEGTTGVGSYATRKAENPWTETAASGQLVSTYVTYTATGGTPAASSATSGSVNFGNSTVNIGNTTVNLKN